MKILYLAVGVFDKGGISRYCRYQIRALREAAGESNVRVLSLLGPSENSFEEEFMVDETFGGFGIMPETAFLSAGLRTALREHPQVIWSSHVRFVLNGLFARRLANARLAVNVYGEEAWSGRLLPLQKRILPRAEMVVSDCEFTADFVASDYNIDRSRISVVWDCVDLDRFEPRPRSAAMLREFGLPDGSGTRYVMTLGRIEARSRYKGYDRLLDAVAAMGNRPEVALIYAGSGDDVDRLRRRADELGLRGRVFFLGSIPESRLCEAYNLCDVFVLVSDRGPGRGEGIPLTPLEAAACGKPIIVGDEDGSREAVVDGINGFCVSPRDPHALRKSLEAILSDDNLRMRMGCAARARIVSEFSYPIFRSKTERVLERLESGVLT